MPYEEKRNILSLLTLVLISLPYIGYIFIRHSGESFATAEQEITFWVSAILIVIPIRIVAEIIGHIVMAIVTAVLTGKEELDTKTDERDRMIELYSSRNSYIAFAISMMLALVAMLVNPSISLFFALLIIGGTIVECIEIGSKAIMYRMSS